MLTCHQQTDEIMILELLPTCMQIFKIAFTLLDISVSSDVVKHCSGANKIQTCILLNVVEGVCAILSISGTELTIT